MKKKTSIKKDTRSPVFNEAMIFNIPAPILHVSMHSRHVESCTANRRP